MGPIRIGGNKDRDTIRDMVDKYFFNSKVKIEEQGYEDRFDFLFYLGKQKSINEISFYDKLANLIQDIIVNIYIKDVIKDRAIKICTEYTSDEKKEIVKLTHGILKDRNSYAEERVEINRNLIDYLIENNNLLIDGYMNFRLKEYLYLVDISIEKSIFALESEKEYEEFLGMLQYFVDIQEPKLELVNVIIKDNNYILLDMDNNILEGGDLDEVEHDLYYEDISKADLLISSLIVISPDRLVVHIEEGEQEEIITVISQVFRDRVTFCDGCEKCSINTKVESEK